MRSYTKHEEFRTFIDKTDNDFSNLYERFKPLVSMMEVDSKMKAIKNSLDVHFKGFSMKKECVADKKELSAILLNLRNMFGSTKQ